MKTKSHSSERTAGLSSHEAVAAVGNRYDLVLIGARRMRELARGALPKLTSVHGNAVTALMEIEAGHVTREYLYRETHIMPRRRNRNY